MGRWIDLMIDDRTDLPGDACHVSRQWAYSIAFTLAIYKLTFFLSFKFETRANAFSCWTVFLLSCSILTTATCRGLTQT